MASYLNTGTERPPPPKVEEYHIDTPLEEYNLNFCLPVRVLEGSGLRLEPLIPSVHGRPLFDIFSRIDRQTQLQLFRFLPYAAPQTLADFLTFIEHRIHRSVGEVLFVVSDATRPYDDELPGGGRYAGWIALINASATDLVAEIGHVVTLPRAQRTHVTTNACALLIKYCLSPPSQGGLGLRRVQYRAHHENVLSNKVPPRFGFTKEGILRCAYVYPAGGDKAGEVLRSNDGETGTPGAGLIRNTVVWSITWADWEKEAKQKIDELLARPSELRPAFPS